MRSQSWIGVGMVVALSLAAGNVVESRPKWPGHARQVLAHFDRAIALQ